jgi:hypothetical protein
VGNQSHIKMRFVLPINLLTCHKPKVPSDAAFLQWLL